MTEPGYDPYEPDPGCCLEVIVLAALVVFLLVLHLSGGW